MPADAPAPSSNPILLRPPAMIVAERRHVLIRVVYSLVRHRTSAFRVWHVLPHRARPGLNWRGEERAPNLDASGYYPTTTILFDDVSSKS